MTARQLPIMFFALITGACSTRPQDANQPVNSFPKGTFGYDLGFLSKFDQLVILRNGDAQVIVSPKYQGKVFTSTAQGDKGKSFGWINYPAFATAPDPHMNAYGGENRLWLGPEGNRFSLFFDPGKPRDYSNWRTPAAFDTEAWDVTSANDQEVTMNKTAELTNYNSSKLKVGISRNVRILNNTEIEDLLKISLTRADSVVGYITTNEITNLGDNSWTRETGAPCIWILDMFTPSPGTVVAIPYKEQGTGKVVTADYFGEVPPERLQTENGLILFSADGTARGKIGVTPGRAKPIAGSYDRNIHVLTLVTFDLDSTATYLNQEWNTQKDPFLGDAVNAYNDGPLEDGSQMGPFYELESVSPAAFLGPGEKLAHRHSVIHITGDSTRVRSLFLSLFPKK